MNSFKNGKKVIALVTAVALTLSLTACGKKTADTASNTTPAPTATVTVVPNGTNPSGSPVPTIAEKDKKPAPSIVLKDESAKNKKLSAKEKETMKRVVAFTEILANNTQVLNSSVAMEKEYVVGTLEVKAELKDTDAKAFAETVAKDMKAAYGKKAHVIITKGGKTVAEAKAE